MPCVPVGHAAPVAGRGVHMLSSHLLASSTKSACQHDDHASCMLHSLATWAPAGKQSVTTNRPLLSTVAELKADIAAQTGGCAV